MRNAARFAGLALILVAVILWIAAFTVLRPGAQVRQALAWGLACLVVGSVLTIVSRLRSPTEAERLRVRKIGAAYYIVAGLVMGALGLIGVVASVGKGAMAVASASALLVVGGGVAWSGIKGLQEPHRNISQPVEPKE